MYNPIDSDLLCTFLAVAKTGNFTQAAVMVGRTQSAISMQIGRLEDRLDEKLFERGSRGVTLTAHGEHLLPYARRIVDLLEEADSIMRSKPLDGPVRIGIPEEYGETVIPHALSVFSERHPAVEVTVKCAYSFMQMEALSKDQLDVAVIFDPDDAHADDVLCIDPTVWVTSVLHKRHEETPVPIAVYDGDKSHWCHDFAIRSLEQHGVRYRVAFSSHSSGGLKMAAASGLCVAALSRSTIPVGCRELTLADGFPPVDSSRVVLRRNPRRSSPAIEGLVETIREAFMPLRGEAG